MASKLLHLLVALVLFASPALALDPAPRFSGVTFTGAATSGPIPNACVMAAKGSVCRTFRDRAGDSLSVRDLGAKLDGSDDTAAYNATRGSLQADGVIDVPPGQYVLNTAPTAGPQTPVLWRMAGNKYGTGGVPVISSGFDTIETVVNGGKYFGRGNSQPNGGPVLRVDSTLNSVNPSGSGTAQNTMSTLQVNMTIPKNTADIGNFGWANSTILNSSAWGSGQHVALASLASRPADALNDGRGPRAVIWAGYHELNDQTGQPANVAGTAVIGEWDLYAAGDDPNYQRIGHHLVFSRPLSPAGAIVGGAKNARFGYGLLLDTQSYDRTTVGSLPATRLGVGYGVAIPFDSAAFDTSAGTSVNGAPAFRMKEEMPFAFDAANRSQMKRVAGAVRFYFDNTELLSISDAGEIRAASKLRTLILNIQDTTAPTSTSDPLGVVGDEVRSGSYLYRKTTSGWLRTTLTTF